MIAPLLECVPNVSDGRDRALRDALAAAVEAAGARLLDVHADVDHNRSVFTFLGPPATVGAAALALARIAVARVDLRQQSGVHPRIGAVDVIPFVPLRATPMAEAVRAARGLGPAFAGELGVPVFYYGAAALRPDRRELGTLRRGQFEALAARMARPGGEPDTGPPAPHPRAGATAIGARPVLIAFNAVLDTDALGIAREIARVLRASAGGLPGVQALGVPLASRGRAQVAMNLVDYRRTPVVRVVEAVEAEAGRRGTTVLEYELVGCAPADAFAEMDRARVVHRPAQLLDPALFAAGAGSGPDYVTS
jgi:glutamate formiminotransferase